MKKTEKISKIAKIATIVILLIAQLTTLISAATDLDVTNFACNPIEAKINGAFSCTATIENIGDAAGHLDTATLYSDDNSWLEDSNYPQSINQDFDAGESTDVTFTSLKATKSGDNGFSKIMLDSVTDTFVDDEGITENIIDVLVTVSNSADTAASSENIEASAEVTAGGNIDVDLTFNVESGGCTITDQSSTKSITGLSNNQKSSKSWTVTMSTSDCVYSITAEATGTGGVASKSDSSSSTITCTGGSCTNDSSSSSSSTTTSGGGGGGGATTASVTSISLSPNVASSYVLDKGASLSFTLQDPSGNTISHSIKLKSIIDDIITLTFSSTSFDVQFKSGETKMIDIDQDGTMDLEVFVEKLSGSQATIKITKLVKATCTDGVRNQNELFTDCGGVCSPCEEISTETKSPEQPSKPIESSTSEQEDQHIQNLIKTFKGFSGSDQASIIAIILTLTIAGYIFYRRHVANS